MARSNKSIQTVKVTDARQQFSELINRVYKERRRVVIEKSGIPVAALISAQDLERFDQMEAQRRRDFAIIDEISAAFDDVPDDELEREVTKAIAAVRADDRRSRSSGARRQKPQRRTRASA